MQLDLNNNFQVQMLLYDKFSANCNLGAIVSYEICTTSIRISIPGIGMILSFNCNIFGALFFDKSTS